MTSGETRQQLIALKLDLIEGRLSESEFLREREILVGSVAVAASGSSDEVPPSERTSLVTREVGEEQAHVNEQSVQPSSSQRVSATQGQSGSSGVLTGRAVESSPDKTGGQDCAEPDANVEIEEQEFNTADKASVGEAPGETGLQDVGAFEAKTDHENAIVGVGESLDQVSAEEATNTENDDDSRGAAVENQDVAEWSESTGGVWGGVLVVLIFGALFILLIIVVIGSAGGWGSH